MIKLRFIFFLRHIFLLEILEHKATILLIIVQKDLSHILFSYFDGDKLHFTMIWEISII